MTELQQPPMTFAPARDATRTARAGWLGIVLAVLVVTLGVLCVREALVADARIDGRPWLAPAVDGLDGLGPSVALAATGVVVALVGLWLVLQAFGRRRRTRLPVSVPGSAAGAPTGTTIGVVDAARLARVAALDVDDVLDARATANRRTVTVTVTVPPGVQVDAPVRTAVAAQLAPLSTPPSIKVVSRVSEGLRTGGIAP
ncbi:hypothetical protein [Cellulomonas sp.]|uniref:hypothetical protein n=1 Tax=Cellulomonas sp. TaxID=40001 RepID=UPI001B1D58BA|nr:hypothetical protein [Cellulomonas sp.]MBO9553230.1 hypothetical protein [Cellulomonas sp.]